MVVFVLIAAVSHGALGRVYGPSTVFAPSMAIVGGLIASRRPRHLIGWLVLFIAFTQAFVETAGVYAHLAYDFQAALPAPDVAAWLSVWMWMPGLGSALTLLPLLFPTGHLLSRRWRWVSGLSVLALTVGISAIAVASWPLRGPRLHSSGGPPPGSLVAIIFPAAGLVVGCCAVAALVSVVQRYRRSAADERHQLKWVGFGAAILVASATSDFITLPPGSAAQVLWLILAPIGALALPVAIGIAILRYRMYDIDLVISRTLAYGALAAMISTVYVAIVVGLGTLAGGGGRPNLLLSIVATAVVAVGFQPARERLQRVANRLVYGTRSTPYEVLSEFSERVAGSYAADDLLPRMAQVLGEGTGAERAAVWLRGGGQLRPAACWPPGGTNSSAPVDVIGQVIPVIPDADRAVPVRHQGELLGALCVSKRSGESLTPIEDKLLDDLANQAGLVLKNVGLTADLHARLDELRASRQRMVTAQDAERRRLERNLHDGAQQNLVALKVKLGVAELMAVKDMAMAKQLMGELKGDIDEALETLRDLARGIYPPLLAQKGLLAALEAQARRATVTVDIRGEGVTRYAQEVEAAVYFCCLEALQNVQKYASAASVLVSIGERAGDLWFEVKDDGAGFDTVAVRRSSGLTNMSDRLDALGGTLEIASAPGKGTIVRGRLPSRNHAPRAGPSCAP